MDFPAQVGKKLNCQLNPLPSNERSREPVVGVSLMLIQNEMSHYN